MGPGTLFGLFFNQFLGLEGSPITASASLQGMRSGTLFGLFLNHFLGLEGRRSRPLLIAGNGTGDSFWFVFQPLPRIRGVADHGLCVIAGDEIRDSFWFVFEPLPRI